MFLIKSLTSAHGISKETKKCKDCFAGHNFVFTPVLWEQIPMQSINNTHQDKASRLRLGGPSCWQKQKSIRLGCEKSTKLLWATALTDRWHTKKKTLLSSLILVALTEIYNKSFPRSCFILFKFSPTYKPNLKKQTETQAVVWDMESFHYL